MEKEEEKTNAVIIDLPKKKDTVTFYPADLPPGGNTKKTGSRLRPVFFYSRVWFTSVPVCTVMD